MIEVDAAALWDDLIELGNLTDPQRPYTRRSFSERFLEGRRWLASRMQDAGLVTRIDAAGNLIGRRQGTRPGADTLLIGSHSDSVPSGGRFDGMAGVLAGIAIARALQTHQRALGHSVEVVDFLAEEPSEFGLSCIGSRGMTSNLSDEHLQLRNEQQETLAAALSRMGGDPANLARAHRSDIAAAFELHIEQGPVLEAEGLDLGIVSAIVGISRLDIEFRGTAGHAGTTPMTQRRDPLLAAAALVGWIHTTATAFAARGQGHFVATVGVLEARPGASNVIAKTARLVVDARSDNRSLMLEFHAALQAESHGCAALAKVECSVFRLASDTLPAFCDAGLRRTLESSATLRGLTFKSMASGAGHDMAFLAAIAPMSMLFIPCKQGRSHTPEEWAEPAALAAGSNVLLAALLASDQPGRLGVAASGAAC